MLKTTLIGTAELASHLGDSGWVIFDSRHDLAKPQAGEAAYRAGHIPGARFISLDRELAAPLTGKNGRHPLPSADDFARVLARHGVDKDTQVVVYDDAGGMFAARLWWMLRWLGHDAVAVLDGGYPKWTKEGRPVSTDIPPGLDIAGSATPSAGTSAAVPKPRALAVDVKDVLANLNTAQSGGKPAFTLVDARVPERHRGEMEPIDPVAGHIPGSLNRPNRDNLAADGTFKPPQQLKSEFQSVLRATPPGEAVHFCGSGVAACHNILAMEVAGLSGSRLYPGSWSEWVADPARPVAKG